MITGISHIGVAVKDVEAAAEFYKTIFGLEVVPPVEYPNLKIAIVKVGNAIIELLESTTAEGPIAKFIKRRGEGIQHICLEVDDIRKDLESLSAKGMEFTDKEPRQGVEGLIAFLHPKRTNGVLIELVEKK